MKSVISNNSIESEQSPTAEAMQSSSASAAVSGVSCCCEHKQTPRSDEFQADLQKRLNRVIGQLGGIKHMIEDNRYCGDVLTQLSAASSALRTISGLVMQNHLETCVTEKISSGDAEVVEETVKLMKQFMR